MGTTSDTDADTGADAGAVQPTFGLTPIDARKRAEQVRDSLIALIRDGQLKDGDKLPTEPQLSAMFGVGRSSVREAVQSLVGLGIIEMRPGRGAFVSRVSLNDLVRMVDGAVRLEYSAALQMHEVRAMLEITAARLAATRRTDEDLEQMARAIDAYRQAGPESPNEALVTSDLAFHRAVEEGESSKPHPHADLARRTVQELAELLSEELHGSRPSPKRRDPQACRMLRKKERTAR